MKEQCPQTHNAIRSGPQRETKTVPAVSYKWIQQSMIQCIECSLGTNSSGTFCVERNMEVEYIFPQTNCRRRAGPAMRSQNNKQNQFKITFKMKAKCGCCILLKNAFPCKKDEKFIKQDSWQCCIWQLVHNIMTLIVYKDTT